MEDGRSTYTEANGDRYKGEWKNDERDGQGTYMWITIVMTSMKESGRMMREMGRALTHGSMMVTGV
eukprot:scaffold169283_cov73-Attheya_sp.AAC.1